jgi:hypothetical protein
MFWSFQFANIEAMKCTSNAFQISRLMKMYPISSIEADTTNSVIENAIFMPVKF